jgi:hypothetical protein
MTWFLPLDVFLEHPTPEPLCPVVCPFHRYCKSYVQEGIFDLLDKGRLSTYRACMYYEGLMQLAREEFARAPESSQDFRELAAERCGIKEELA